jgi:hypothetical protein
LPTILEGIRFLKILWMILFFGILFLGKNNQLKGKKLLENLQIISI